MKTNSKSIAYILSTIALILLISIAIKYKRQVVNIEKENVELRKKIELLTKQNIIDSVQLAKNKIEVKKENEKVEKINKKDTITISKSTTINFTNANYIKDENSVIANEKIVSNKNVITSKKERVFIDNSLNKNFSNNVTSYSKLKNINKKSIKTTNKSPKATIYKKNKQFKTTTKSNENNISTKKINDLKNKINHGIPVLDKANNVENINTPPIFPGCESKNTTISKKNCLNTKISSFVYTNFNTNIPKKLKYKGFNEIRVLFIIDKNGRSKAIKTIGNWPIKIKNEAKRVVNSLPKMIPGKINQKNIDVKYSIKIPFNIK